MTSQPKTSRSKKSPYFTADTLTFLRDLAENNDRDWFEENKERYEEEVRGPAIQFILDFGERLSTISPHLRADPRRNGGSLFRIYRNMRFAPEGTPPYKTHTGIQFRHEAGRDVHAPGIYLHVEPGGCFFGCGVWHPGSKALKRIRTAIVEDPEGWKEVAHAPELTERFELAGDALKRGPRDFDWDHPLIDDIKRKDFIAVRELSEEAVTRPELIDDFEELCRETKPFMTWLCEAVGVPY